MPGYSFVGESGMLDDKDNGSSRLLTIFTVVIAESELPLSSVTVNLNTRIVF